MKFLTKGQEKEKDTTSSIRRQRIEWLQEQMVVNNDLSDEELSAYRAELAITALYALADAKTKAVRMVKKAGVVMLIIGGVVVAAVYLASSSSEDEENEESSDSENESEENSE